MGPITLLVLGIAIVVIGIAGFRWHPFLALILAALTVAALTPTESIFQAELDHQVQAVERKFEADTPEYEVEMVAARRSAESKSKKWFVSRVTDAFGDGCGGLAILIAMAAIIGNCLLDSGGARRIVESLMSWLGIKRTPIAFAASAFTLGIPVFFDTVFYLLMPLGKALRRKTGKDYLLYILTIVAGATMAHSLVPPTPGPLTVAGFFEGEVSIGSMMLGGLVVGAFTVTAGVAFAYWANRKWEIPLREVEGESAEDIGPETMPPLWAALLPILLPVVLIASQTIAKEFFGVDSIVLKFLGDKNLALILAAVSALGLLLYSSRRNSGIDMARAVRVALASGGVIILITAAGKAFGSVLKDTGIAGAIGSAIEGSPSLALIPIAYGVTALIRTAQGSATVAMITAGGLISPLVSEFDLSYSALYLALAIGCGSKPISWANDSGFWVIGRMSGMTPVETFKSVSMMMLVMSLVGLAVILLGAIALPLA